MRKCIIGFILALIVCLSLGTVALAAESEDGFDATVTINRETEGKIIVTVNADDSILASKQPTLSVPCEFTYARVTGPDGAVLAARAEVIDDMISFTVAAGGTYTVQQLFAVTLTPNNGSGATPRLACSLDGKLESLPSPTREGYSFKGWFDASEGGNEVTTDTVFTADATIYAQWAVNQYTITYSLDGGSASNPETYTIESDTITLTQPTKTGYDFVGWTYEDQTEPVETVTIAQGSTGNKTFAANWTINQYTISFVGADIAPIIQDYGTKVEAPENPTKTGYTFVGWNPAIPENMPVEGLTVTAQWTVNQYTITFDSNGGSAVAAITQDYGTQINAPADPTRDNYDFLGWDKDIPSTMPAENMTITAQWQYDPPYVPVVPSTPSKPTTSTETTKNEDGSTTTTVTNNKTGTVTETTEKVDGSTVTVETKKDGTVTEITERADGSTTTVETKADGTVTETVENTDGSTVTTQTNADGSSTATTELVDGTVATVTTGVTGETKTEVTVSDKAAETAAETGEAVTLPIPALETTADGETASVITVITDSEEPVAVKIPVAGVSTSTVAVIVNEDGTETVVTETKMTENGLVVDVPDGATVKIVDNSIDFDDVEEEDWEKDAVNFASARGLVNGMGNNRFDLDSSATRAQVVTLLARLSGVDTTPGEGELWYDKGHEWAVANGITYEGSMNVTVSRQSMFTMMWRMLGAPESDHDISHFTDTDGLTQYTQTAARWAVEIGLIQGYGNGIMDPTGAVTRGQLAQFMMNFIQLT